MLLLRICHCRGCISHLCYGLPGAPVISAIIVIACDVSVIVVAITALLSFSTIGAFCVVRFLA